MTRLVSVSTPVAVRGALVGLGGQVDRDAARRRELEAALTERDEIIGDAVPALGKHPRDFSQRALIAACKITGGDPYDWSDYPDVLDRLLAGEGGT